MALQHPAGLQEVARLDGPPVQLDHPFLLLLRDVATDVQKVADLGDRHPAHEGGDLRGGQLEQWLDVEEVRGDQEAMELRRRERVHGRCGRCEPGTGRRAAKGGARPG